MTMTDDLIEIGFVREAHGLRGQVVIHAYSGREESLTQYGPLQNADGTQSWEIEVINAKGRDFLCTVKGVADRNQAEALRGTKFFVSATLLPPPPEDEYYVRDLIGLAVFDTAGTPLGTVVDMADLGADSAFDIEFIHDGARPLPALQRELLLYTKQNILQVDLAAKTLTIDLPHGLLETKEKEPQ